MDPLLLEKLVREIVHNEIIGNWLYWFLMLCVALVAGSFGSYVVAYFRKRAEDHAALQALEKITRTVEDVKSELQARHTLRFAALDKRLQAHQDAFMHVVSLAAVFFADREYIVKAMQQCRIWYSENALFLDAEAKRALDSAFNATRNQIWRRAKDSYQLPDEQEQYQTVLSALDAITESVGLPPLKGDLKNILSIGDDETP
jgi:hypothetical protein